MTGMPDPLPLVSVIVSSGCDERQLQAALESVFAQDHAPIELLVIESGLGDRTAQMAREYLGQERVRSRVRGAAFVAAEAGIDLPAALNRAVLESHGEYIGLLNGDERFAAGRLTALLGACVSNGAQIAFSRVEPIAGETAPSSAEIEHVYSVQDNIEFFPTVGYALLRQPCMLSPGNLFFRRASSIASGDSPPAARLRLGLRAACPSDDRAGVRRHAAVPLSRAETTTFRAEQKAGASRRSAWCGTICSIAGTSPSSIRWRPRPRGARCSRRSCRHRLGAAWRAAP